MDRPAELLDLLTRAERLLARRLRTVVEAAGRTLDEWRVITLLADGEGHFMTELSERAYLPPGSLTRLVDTLVDDNLLYRRVDDVDRRRIRAHLTPRGRWLHERLSAQIEVGLADVPFDADDRAGLDRILGGLADSLTGSGETARVRV